MTTARRINKNAKATKRSLQRKKRFYVSLTLLVWTKARLLFKLRLIIIQDRLRRPIGQVIWSSVQWSGGAINKALPRWNTLKLSTKITIVLSFIVCAILLLQATWPIRQDNKDRRDALILRAEMQSDALAGPLWDYDQERSLSSLKSC